MENSPTPGMKPNAIRISQWGPATEVIYGCPICAASFAVLGSKEQFCHNCGQPVLWGVIVRVNRVFSDLYHSSCISEQHMLMQKINEYNQSIGTDVAAPQELPEGICLPFDI